MSSERSESSSTKMEPEPAQVEITIGENTKPVSPPKNKDPSTVWSTIWALINLGFGIIYIHDCQVDPRIPVLLIVMGVLMLIENLIRLIRYAVWRMDVQKPLPTEFDVAIFLLGLASFCVWIACVYFVLRIGRFDFRDKDSTAYCNRYLHGFVYWSFIVFLFALFCCCCCGCCDDE